MTTTMRPDVEPMRVWRSRWNMTQADLAEASGVSRQTISNIERGTVRPIRLVRIALAEALEAPSPEYVTELRD